MPKKKKLIPYSYEFDSLVDELTEGYGDSLGYPRGKNKYVGVELEFLLPTNMEGRNLAAAFIEEGITKGVEIKGDGSINGNGVEVCLLAKQSEISGHVKKVCKALKKIGCKVNKSCGLHVHLDMRNRDKRKSFKALVEELPELTKMVDKSRLKNTYCQINKTKELDKIMEVNSGSMYNPTTDRYEYPRVQCESFETNRYLAINPWSLDEHNTIEVRLHEGTIDDKKINSWIKKLVETVEKATLS